MANDMTTASEKEMDFDDERLRFSWDVLPAASAEMPGTGGNLREDIADFVVEEIPSYLPSGAGTHAYAFIEKRELTTMDVVSALAEAGVPRRAVGFAGQKDKYAVARQWISVPAEYATAFESMGDVEGLTVLETSLHRNKLGLGHLRGNRFSVRVRNPRDDWQTVAEDVLAHLRGVGVPNYFGPQRFGSFNTNIVDGLRLIRGEKMRVDRRMQRFYQSALQSHLFNWLLKIRMEHGLFGAVLAGDRAQKHDTGGMFVVEDGAAESERVRGVWRLALRCLCSARRRGSAVAMRVSLNCGCCRSSGLSMDSSEAFRARGGSAEYGWMMQQSSLRRTAMWWSSRCRRVHLRRA